jgi:hypothetical protein
MKNKQQQKSIEQEQPKEVQKNWQSFKVLKQFPTMTPDNVVKVYLVGEKFNHYDKRVINFLKSQKII